MDDEARETTRGSSVTTFVFHDEDHTLGNSLRYCLSKHPNVMLAGYDVPHPSEQKVQIRVQTDGEDTRKCLIDAAKALGTIADTYMEQLKQQIK